MASAVADHMKISYQADQALRTYSQQYTPLCSTDTNTMRSFCAQQHHMQLFTFVFMYMSHKFDLCLKRKLPLNVIRLAYWASLSLIRAWSLFPYSICCTSNLHVLLCLFTSLSLALPTALYLSAIFHAQAQQLCPSVVWIEPECGSRLLCQPSLL